MSASAPWKKFNILLVIDFFVFYLQAFFLDPREPSFR